MKKLFFLCFLFLVSGVAFSKEPLRIVSTFSILADLVKEIGGDRVHVDCIVGPDSDPHIYEPRPSDIIKISNAQIIFINGLGFEGWLERLMSAAESDGKLVVATDHIYPRLVFEGTVVQDPHAWHSVANTKIYITNIRDKLIEIDPSSEKYYERRFQIFYKKLTDLDKKIREKIDKIPPERRKIITAHDAFGYFGNAYGVQFMAPQGISTESEARVHQVIFLIKQIKALKVKTIFIENISDPKLIEQIGKEAGAKIGGTLYSDALSGPEGPASSYIKMMEYNIDLLLKAMSL
ncbi:MAG: metal ABC transporter substrate-binding protein [Alphaproteobacteria bacterium]